MISISRYIKINNINISVVCVSNNNNINIRNNNIFIQLGHSIILLNIALLFNILYFKYINSIIIYYISGVSDIVNVFSFSNNDENVVVVKAFLRSTPSKDSLYSNVVVVFMLLSTTIAKIYMLLLKILLIFFLRDSLREYKSYYIIIYIILICTII
jgi:hypothetical protein